MDFFSLVWWALCLLHCVGAPVLAQGGAGDPTWHHERARAALERKDYEAAAKEWKAIADLMPESAEVRSNLGLMHHLQGNREMAIEAFEDALRLDPALASARVFLGIGYYLVSRPTQAIKHLEKGRVLDPNSPLACKWLAMSYLLAGRPGSTIAELTKCRQLDPSDHEFTFFLGRAYLKQSSAAFQMLRTAGSETPWFFLSRGRQFANQQSFDEAVEEFQAAARLDPAFPGIHYRMGEAVEAEGDLLGAANAYISELRNHPTHLRAAVALIKVLHALGLHGEAQRARKLAEQTHEGNEAALNVLAQTSAGAKGGDDSTSSEAGRDAVLAFLDQWPPPLEFATPDGLALATLLSGDAAKVLRLAGADQLGPRSAYWKGRALLEEGRLEAAHSLLSSLWDRERMDAELAYSVQLCAEQLSFQELQTFAAKAPDSYRLHQLRAEYLAARNEAGKAIEEYHKALDLNPGAAQIHLAIGDLLTDAKDFAGALDAYAAELKNDPYSVAALTRAGDIYSSHGEYAQGEQLLIKALAIDPLSAPAHKALGKSYFDQRNFEKTVEHMEFAIQHGIDKDETVYYHLGRAHQRLGNKEKAAESLAKLKDLQRQTRERAQRRLEESLRDQKEP